MPRLDNYDPEEEVRCAKAVSMHERPSLEVLCRAK